MVSNVSSSSGAYFAKMFASQLSQKLTSADTDGKEGLSKDELTSLTSGTDDIGSNFLNTLSNNFDSVDSDGDGEITTGEISSLFNQKILSTKDVASSASSLGDNTEDALVSAIKQDLNSYTIGTSKSSSTSSDTSACTSSSLEDNSGSVPATGGGTDCSKMDLNKDGVVSQEEMTEYLAEQAQQDQSTDGATNAAQNSGKSSKSDGSSTDAASALDGTTIASRIFAEMDTNKDGVISEDELKSYEAKQKEKTQTKVQAMVENNSSTAGTDKDSTGKTSSASATNPENKMGNLLKEAFSQIDTNNDGQISLSELNDYANPQNVKNTESAGQTANSGSNNTSSNSTSDSLKTAAKNFAKLSESFVEKLIDKYADNLTSYASSLGIAS